MHLISLYILLSSNHEHVTEVDRSESELIPQITIVLQTTQE